MKAAEFLAKYEKAETEQAKEMQIKALVHTAYLPLAQKAELIEGLIYSLLEDSGGLKTYNSIIKYAAFITAAIGAYTKLEIEDTTNDFDLLQSHELTEKIVAAIGGDYEDLYTLFEMRFEDTIQQSNTLEAVVNHKLTLALQRMDDILQKAETFLGKLDRKELTRIFSQLAGELGTQIKIHK